MAIFHKSGLFYCLSGGGAGTQTGLPTGPLTAAGLGWDFLSPGVRVGMVNISREM